MCRVNQLTGFYMIATLVFNGLMKPSWIIPFKPTSEVNYKLFSNLLKVANKNTYTLSSPLQC